ncbi:LrgB family protein [Brevibacillus fluminis]|uniref:LrgB family protein n=1 Tax=Brevibacillus fluminis TaxID=511487 RepID=UPI003F8C0E8F
MLSAAAIILTLIVYAAVRRFSHRLKWVHPIIAASVVIGVIWYVTSGDWAAYAAGGQWISVWLGPATVALAVPLAKQLQELKTLWPGILLGVGIGCGTSIAIVWALVSLLGGDPVVLHSMLSKSVTTPISVELAKAVGGNPSLAALFTAGTGLVGASMARSLLKIARINDPWAAGIAVGTTAHAIGTAGFPQEEQQKVAASTLAMIMAGIITSLYLVPFHLG